MRAKRFSNDRTGTTQPRRTSQAKLEAMGREWGRAHGLKAQPYGNLVHDRACAVAVKEMTGQYPEWGAERLKEMGLTPPRLSVQEEFRNRGPIRYWVKEGDKTVSGPFHSRDEAAKYANEHE